MDFFVQRFVPCRSLLLALVLCGCGGLQEGERLPVEETPGTENAALCSGLSVTSLTVTGVSTYQGEMAGSGDWTLSSVANAIRLEYLVDGAVVYFEERLGASGTWYFSNSNVACGSHTFQVKAYPMVIDSAGTRTTCSSNPTLSTMYNPNEACPTPTATLNCSRPFKATEIQCTGSSSGGTGSHTPYWQINTANWSSGGWTKTQSCPTSCPTGTPPQYCQSWQVQLKFKVIDAAGRTSNIGQSLSYTCTDDIR